MTGRTQTVFAAAAALVLAIVALGLFVPSLDVWTMPTDDWGVNDQGHDVYAFMAAAFQTVALILSLVAFRLGEFAAGRRGEARSPRAGSITVAAIGFVWAANTIGESLQSAWSHTGDGVPIEVAAPFLAIGFVASFRASRRHWPAPGNSWQLVKATGVGLFSAVAAGLALPLIAGGIDLIGTPLWGYNDSGPVTYLMFGGPMAIVGISLLWSSVLLAGAANQVFIGNAMSTNAGQTMRLATGLLFALLAPTFAAIAIAFAQTDPDYSSSGPLIVPYTLAASCLALLSATLTCLLLWPRRHDRTALTGGI